MSYKVLRDCKAVPFEIRKAFGTGSHNDDPMRLLWVDVAARMTLDACGVTSMSKADKSEYREHLVFMGEAQAWFRNDYDSVMEVFSLAEIEDAEMIRDTVLAHINSKGDDDAQRPE